jgi:hypothetical protein
MIENYTIEYTRNIEESRKVYFNKDFKKSLWIQIVKTILLAPGCIIFAFLSTIAFQVLFKIDEQNDFVTYLFTAILSVIFLYPFVRTIYRMQKFVKAHLNELYKTKQVITTICTLNTTAFNYKNDFFEFNTTWENTKRLKMDATIIQFQTITPSILFLLPKDKVSQEALELLKSKVVSR